MPNARTKRQAGLSPSRREKTLLRREAVLDAAETIFARRGYDSLTMTDVAALADCAIGSLYLDYPSKPALARAVYARRIESLLSRVAEFAERNDWSDLRAVAGELFDLLYDERERHPALVALADRREADAEAVRAQVLEHFSGIFSRARPGLDAFTLQTAVLAFSAISRAARFLNAEPDNAVRAAALRQLRCVTQDHLAAALAGGHEPDLLEREV